MAFLYDSFPGPTIGVIAGTLALILLGGILLGAVVVHRYNSRMYVSCLCLAEVTNSNTPICTPHTILI